MADKAALIAMADAAAEKHGIPRDLFHGLVAAESNWDPRAVPTDKAGNVLSSAKGLTQLINGTAKSLGVQDAFDPQQNLEGGAKHLRSLYDHFGDWDRAVAAYHDGQAKVDSAGITGDTGRPYLDSVHRHAPRDAQADATPAPAPSPRAQPRAASVAASAGPLFIDTSGEVVPVAPTDVPGAQRLGWVPASPEQTKDFELQQKYGTGTEAAKAFVEHAASALTLGASDVAERATGLSTPEAMAGREKANPGISGAGTAFGIAVPLVATLGAAGPAEGAAQAASLAAPSLIARAGEATSAAVRSALPAADSAVGRIAARAAASGAGSAIEGAAYGLGQVVHEAALGDPDLTAQKALATVGLSSVLAGGIGAAGGFLAGALPEVMPRDLGAKVSDLLDKAEGHSNLNATNARPGEIRKVFTSKGEESATKIGTEARDLGIIRNPFTDSPDSIAERAGMVKTEAGQTLSRIVGEASAAPDAPVTSFDGIRSEVEGPIVKALKREGATFQVGEQFEALMDRYAQAYADRPLDLEGAWKLKQDVGEFIFKNGKQIDPWAKELNTPLKRVYDHIDQLVESGIRETSGADAASQWAEGNRAFEVASTMERLANKGIERSAENNAVHLTGQVGAMAGLVAGGAPGAVALGIGSELVRRRGASALGWAARSLREAIGGDAIEGVVNKTAEVIAAQRSVAAGAVDTVAQAADNAPEKVATLSLLERLNQRTQSKIEHGISAVLRGAQKAGRGEVEAGIASAFGKSPEDARAAFSRRTAQVRQLSNDPQLMQSKLEAQTEDWRDHAPNTAQALNVTSARAISFLASKLPVSNAPSGPLAGKTHPSRSDISKFTRYYEAVQNPLGVLRQAAAGTLTPEAIEAVQTVYPHLLDQIRAAAVEKMGKAKSVPYSQKLMLSMLVGSDLDGTMASAARNFAIYARPQAQPMQGRPPKSQKFSLANRMLTPDQASAQRRR